ncbi:MAG: SUMF1/EgtB/PvdO family nonheme iron enzyme [Deltaproteobacteria bacterium]|nr:SUMF1/EgtB/PvdO family nonheme iron enzyme [Deltaproteobacteria bacterium]
MNARTIYCLILVILTQSCVHQRCYENRDCPYPKECTLGRCEYKCTDDSACGIGFKCVNYECEPAPNENEEQEKKPLNCPEEMVPVAEVFCIDRFEASRPDATETSTGSDSSRALSARGVLPWQAPSNEVAEAACAASNKRLCTAQEWELACTGPDKTIYGYGNSYDPLICNGIETFGRDGYHLLPTGSLADCTNEWGVFDINGNLWERTAGGSDKTVRGGAYNCIDSETLHRCDYVPGDWDPSALGFRCCLTPKSASDGGVP